MGSGRFVLPLFLVVLFVGLSVGAHDQLAEWQTNLFGPGSRALSRTVGVLAWLSGALLAMRLTRALVWDGFVARRSGAPVPKMLTQVSALVILLVALTCIVGFVFDESVTGMLTTSGAVGLLLGFAARSIIMDLFSGLSINMERPFVVGEFIQVAGRGPAIFGRVEEITMRTTRLLTAEGSMQVVPNSIIGEAIILNVSRPTPISEFEIIVPLDFEVPVERARRILQAALQQAVTLPSGPLAKPEPRVSISGLVEYGVNYKIKYHLDPRIAGPGKVRNVVWTCVLEHLARVGLAPSIRKQQPWTLPAAKPHHERIGALMAKEPVLAGLDPSVTEGFIRAMKRRPLSTGEKLLTVAEARTGLYVLEEGFLAITMPTGDESGDAPVGHILPGEFFVSLPEEMSAVAIGATSESVILAVEDDAAKPLLADPRARAAMSEIAARIEADRNRRLEVYRAAESSHSQVVNKDRLFSHLAGRMRDFFSARGGLVYRVVANLMGAQRSQRLVEATMAACALVATADGSVDPEERQQVIASFEELGFFRHVPASEAIAMFDANVAGLLEDSAETHARMLEAIGKLRGDQRTAELVLSICRAVSAADGVVDASESKRIGEIAVALGLPEANTGHFDEAI